MGAALEIRTELARPARLRRLARRERNPRAASRMLAIAGALGGAGGDMPGFGRINAAPVAVENSEEQFCDYIANFGDILLDLPDLVRVYLQNARRKNKFFEILLCVINHCNPNLYLPN